MTSAMSSSDPLLVRENGPVLYATMNRPEHLNALDDDLRDRLTELFASLYWRDDIRVVVLAGAGRAFCAGADLHRQLSWGEFDRNEMLTGQRRFSEIMIAMRRCPQPIVGLIDGPACGGGLALALACDIRMGTPRTKMNAAFIKIGLSGCDVGVSYFLPRAIGTGLAAEYMMTGRFVDAEKAQALGLIGSIVDPDDIEFAADELVGELLAATPIGLRLTKEALNHSINAASLEAAVAMEDRNQILAASSPDYREGVAAFLEKRRPEYAGHSGGAQEANRNEE